MESKEEKVLNAILLDPSVKHKTIVDTFDQLEEGESFILHNDHDPKPLYYQLSATKGDIFTWDYLQQGPSIFEIRIAKKILNGQQILEPKQKDKVFIDHITFDANTPETVRTIVAKDFRTVDIFQKMGVDYAWKADVSIADICKKHLIDEAKLRRELNAVTENYSLVVPSQDYYQWGMSFLADYILNTHHRYVKSNAERISKLAETVAEKYGQENKALQKLGTDVRPMIKDFMVHMSKEEDVLFPAIKQMLKTLEKEEKSKGPGGAIKNAVAKMEAEHDETKTFLDQFRIITNHYSMDVSMPNEQKQLYHELQMFENDTYKHVHLENNILFPKLILLEGKITA